MNIIGKWELRKIGIFDEELGMQMKTIEEIMKMEETEEVLQAREMSSATLHILEDGTLRICAIMPPEAVAEMEEAGEEIPFNEDGTVTVQECPWKIENDVVYYNIGDEGEIDGEEFDPWLVAQFDENGLLIFGFMAFEKL